MRPFPGVWLCVVAVGCLGEAPSNDVVNDVVGDASWVEAYGTPPGEGVDDIDRVRTHLAYVEKVLRARDVSDWPVEQRAARARNLDRLRAYWEAGLFPENPEDGVRAPRFMDDDPGGELGVEAPRLCAVGALLAADLGVEAARTIDAGFRYDRIGDIESEALRAWAETSGLDDHELAMIQPKYGPRPPPIEVGQRPTPQAIRRAVAQRLAQVNACVHARLGARDEHPKTIEADVTIGPEGRVARLALSTGLDPENLSIQRCVASTLDTIAFEPFRGAAVSAKQTLTIVRPTTDDGDLSPAYLPVVFRRGEALVRACARESDPEVGHIRVLVEADVGAGGVWEAIGVSVLDGPGDSRFRSCVRRSVVRLTLPDYEGVSRRASHVYALTVN